MKTASDYLFVDSSGWLAYLDPSDPNHAQAITSLAQASGAVITSDSVLWELSSAKPSGVDAISLASLMWNLWDEQVGELLEATEEDHSMAWKVFQKHRGPSPSFTDCINLVLLSKHKIGRWMSFNQWLPKTSAGIEEALAAV